MNGALGRYTATADTCPPVLVGVKAGTAAYDATPANDYSNGHNYFILRFSEQMDYQTTGTVLGTANIASNSNTRVGDYGVDGGTLGHIDDSSGTVTVEGLMEYTGVFDSGYIPDFSGEPNPDYVNAIERTDPFEIRIDIAAYYYAANSEWAGYLGETGVTLTDPGNGTTQFYGVYDSTSTIQDLVGNDSAAVNVGRMINENMGFAAGSDWNAITETGWDVDPPLVAPL